MLGIFLDNRCDDFTVTGGFFWFLYAHVSQRHKITVDRAGHIGNRGHHCVVCFCLSSLTFATIL